MIRVRISLRLALHLEPEPHIGEKRSETLETWAGVIASSAVMPLTESIRIRAGNFSLERGRADRPGDEVSLAKSELAGLVGRHVHVSVARLVAR